MTEKKYLVLDCETATLPFVAEYKDNLRNKIALARPLIYDLGWLIVDEQGEERKRVNYLIAETFSVPQIFNTAYYRDKRPIYIDKLNKSEIALVSWNKAISELLADMQSVEAVGAYNAMFDFKKAIAFTEQYIKNLYGNDFNSWIDIQKRICATMDKPYTRKYPSAFDGEHFSLRGVTVPLFDLWGLTCEHILNSDEYRKTAKEKEWKSASGKYYSTTAENAYRFISGNEDFNEAHTAIDDCNIEALIFAVIAKITKNEWQNGIIHFPFKIVGKWQEGEDEGE